MKTLSQFRSFDLAQGEDGSSLELQRDDRHVVFLAFDTRRLCFAELCVLIDEGGGFDERTTRIFTERARVASSMSHPGWAALFESGVDDGVFYYTREFVDGERLGDYLGRVGSLPEAVALDLAIQLGEALLVLESLPDIVAEVDFHDARLFCDSEGGIAVKLPGFPLEPVARRPRGASAAGSTRVMELFRRLVPGGGVASQSELDPGDGGALALSTLIRRMRAVRGRFPRQALGSDFWPKRLLAEEIYKRRKPREFLSQDFQSVPNAEDPWNPYSQTLVGPKGRILRLQVLPPPRLLRDEFLTFQKAGAQAAGISIHAQWKNDDFRLIAEETAPGRSLANLLDPRETLARAEESLLLGRISAAIGNLEAAGVTIPDFRPENVFVCFEDPGGVDLDGLAARRPATAWPEFHIRLRTHLTMSGLTHPPDVWGLSRSANAVFEYLSLRGQGLRERASQLLAKVDEEAARDLAGGTGGLGAEVMEMEPDLPMPGAGEIFFSHWGPGASDGEAGGAGASLEVADPVLEEPELEGEVIGDSVESDDYWDEDPETPVAVWGEMGLVGAYADEDEGVEDEEDYEEDYDDEVEGEMDWDPEDEDEAAYEGPVLSPIAAAMVGDERLAEDHSEHVAEWEGVRRGVAWLWVLLFLLGAGACGLAIAHYTGQGFWVR